MKGLIFNIQRYSIHDGSGIRTIVFFKGCPLKCPWCCNPESQRMTLETWQTDHGVETMGRWMTVEEVLREVEKDEIFYRVSDGGVTLSGGEVLLQAKFATELLKEVQSMNINTAIETTGHGDTEEFKRLSDYVDTVLFDLKIMNPLRAKQVENADVHLIQRNFDMLLEKGVRVVPRIPLIPGYTAEQDNLESIISFLQQRKIPEAHLLPFHQYGSRKYEYLGKEYTMKDAGTLTNESLHSIASLFMDNGIETVIEGLS